MTYSGDRLAAEFTAQGNALENLETRLDELAAEGVAITEQQDIINGKLTSLHFVRAQNETAAESVRDELVLSTKNAESIQLTDIPHIPSKFVEIVPLSHRQGNCIPYAAIRWHDFGNRPALGRPLGHFSRHPDTPLLSLSPRRRFPRPTPERVFVADHQSSSGFSGTGPSAPPPQPIGT